MSETIDLKWVDAPAAERIDAASPVTIEPHMLDPGQFYPQGDVALVKLATLPDGCKRVEKPQRQIVEGTTQGSRHIWDSLDGIEVFRLPNETPLDGLVYRLTKTRTLTHPEHADQTYVVPEGEELVFRVRYQRAYAEELRRIQD